MIRCIVLGMILMVLVSAGPIPKEFRDVAPEVRKICLADSGVSEDLVVKVTQGEFTDDPKLKSYLKCVFTQFGLIRKKQFSYKTFLGLAPPDFKESAIKLVNACNGTTGADVYDMSFNLHKCFYEALPDVYFIA